MGILKLLDDLGHSVWVARRIDIARHWLATTGTASNVGIGAKAGRVQA